MEKLYVTHRGPNWPLLMEMLHHSQGAQSDLYLWKMLHHSRGPQLIFINGKTLRHSWGAPTDLYWWKNLTSLMGGRNWPLLMEMLHHSQGAQSDLYLWKMLHHSRGPQLIFINGKTLRHSWGAPTDLYWWKNLTSLTRGPDWPLLMEKRYVNHRGPLRSLDLYQLIYINLNICGEEFSGFPSLFCVLFKINTHQTFKDTRPKPAYGRQGLDWNYNGPPLIQKHHVTHGGPQPTF